MAFVLELKFLCMGGGGGRLSPGDKYGFIKNGGSSLVWNVFHCNGQLKWGEWYVFPSMQSP